MSKYKIELFQERNGFRWAIYDNETNLYFAGYDFMGSVNWSDKIKSVGLCWDWTEAKQIVTDIIAADD